MADGGRLPSPLWGRRLARDLKSLKVNSSEDGTHTLAWLFRHGVCKQHLPSPEVTLSARDIGHDGKGCFMGQGNLPDRSSDRIVKYERSK